MHYTKKVLENGLRIIMVPMQDNETVTVMTLVEAGSEYEKDVPSGISHFLEHMCFKGTMKRPHSSIINTELDGLGSTSNAFTSSDATGYYAKAHHSKTAELIDIVSDIYLHSTFPEDEIEKEKGVVIEEINMYEDQPQSKVSEVLDEAMYKGQLVGYPIIGSKESVRSIKREDLVSYHQKLYVPEATLVIVAGKIDEVEVFKQIENAFGSFEARPKYSKPAVNDRQEDPIVSLHEKVSEQTHILLAFRTFDMYDERKYEASFLASVLGSGMSSRLFEIIREKLGLAYYVGCGMGTGRDYGRLVIRMGVSNSKAYEAVQAVVGELNRIKKELISDTELKKVKDMRKGNFYLGLESSDEWADFYGFQEIYQRDILGPEELLKKREAITLLGVQEMAQALFVSSKATLALVGPKLDASLFEKALKMLD